MGAKCDACKHVMLPPQSVCGQCYGYDLSWIELSGRGKLLYASVGKHRLMGLDFIQGTVKLEEGPLVPGMVIVDDFDFSHPEIIWNYNVANISVLAEIVKNPLGVESIAFRIIEPGK